MITFTSESKMLNYTVTIDPLYGRIMVQHFELLDGPIEDYKNNPNYSVVDINPIPKQYKSENKSNIPEKSQDVGG